tara:strand:- start:3993 stop:4283 length:291 start_codon:yes stop_codon:yes gene_type:complete
MLKCPSCGTSSLSSSGGDSVVLESRNREETTPYLRRRRKCTCGHLFTTREYEVDELKSIFREKSRKANNPEVKTEELEDILQDLNAWVDQLNKEDS